jgi:hypothetical protein
VSWVGTAAYYVVRAWPPGRNHNDKVISVETMAPIMLGADSRIPRDEQTPTGSRLAWLSTTGP